MSENRRSILQMLAESKITAEEAERLIAALERSEAAAGPLANTRNGRPRPTYLRVAVDTDEPRSGPTKVNVRVPISLLKAGVRLTSIIPPAARDEVNLQLAKHGVALDLNQLRPENLDELIEQLNDLTVDVDQEKTKVRIFCE